MALLDYKIVSFSHVNRHVVVKVRVYRGTVGAETEFNSITHQNESITRYRRAAKVREFTLTYDVPRDMTREEFIQKARAYLNKRLLDYAAANGHTVITEQQDITGLEEVSNPIET